MPGFTPNLSNVVAPAKISHQDRVDTSGYFDGLGQRFAHP